MDKVEKVERAMAEVCRRAPFGSSLHGLLFSQRLALAQSAVAALDATPPETPECQKPPADLTLHDLYVSFSASGTIRKWDRQPFEIDGVAATRFTCAPETADERQAAIVAALRDDAQRCDCFAHSDSECTCGAWDTEPGERSYKRKGVEDIADWIESGEWRRA